MLDNGTYLALFICDVTVDVYRKLFEFAAIPGSRATSGVAILKPETRDVASRAAVDSRCNTVDVLDVVVMSSQSTHAQ